MGTPKTGLPYPVDIACGAAGLQVYCITIMTIKGSGSAITSGSMTVQGAPGSIALPKIPRQIPRAFASAA